MTNLEGRKGREKKPKNIQENKTDLEKRNNERKYNTDTRSS